MKKTACVLILAFAAAALFAQKGFDQRARPETVTVAGKLALVNGRIAVQSQDAVYYVRGIQRLVGFVDGLKEGAQVSLEGYARNLDRENAKVMMASRLTIGGRSYDLVPAGGPNDPSRRAAPPKRWPNAKPGWDRRGAPGWGRNAPCWDFYNAPGRYR